MKNFLKIYALTVFVVGVLLASGCTTQKVRGEYSGLKKVYHNTTMRYNGYFNATVLLEESKQALKAQHVDNYNKILPIYPESAADNPKAVAEPLDNAMEKVSVAVSLHRGANWTDDCYLLLGQAQYYKQDYEAAEETFEFMEVEFSSDPKKRGSLSKKARERQAKDKKAKEEYKKQRLKEIQEERKARDDARRADKKERDKARKDSKKTREKEAKAKKKTRDNERKEREKEMKAYKKAVAAARKKGTKPPPRPGTKRSASEEKKEETKVVETKPEKKKKNEEEEVVEDVAKEEEEKKEDKKPEDDPENYFLKHRPIYKDAMLWLARTYIERDNWNLADRHLSTLEGDAALAKEVAKELPVVRAYFYTEQKEYAQAIPHLEKAIELENDRYVKARYTYIISQIKEKEGNIAEALAGYEQVLKYRPGYDMEFSTRLNILKSKYNNGKETADKTTKSLERLLKDIKNEEYQDQIYFTLAQIAFAENKTDEGIAYLESSLSVPASNTANQAEAFYQLAKVYLEKEDYINAKSYFDSTVGVLPKNDERYEEAKTLADNLTEIAANLEVINLQDSLLMMSKLTDEERRTRTLEIKKAENEKRLAAIKAKQNGKTSALIAGNNNVRGRAGSKPSSFFAYDDRAMKKGAREFVRDWGTRPLEDNWRTGEDEAFDENIEDEIETLANTVITDEDVEKLFKDVPDTPEQKAASQEKIEEAMFNLGRLYRDKLKYNKKTIAVLEDLLKRNPDTKFEPDALYYLYLAYQDEGNMAKANEVKNKLMAEYAETTFARVIKNPDYVNTVLNKDYQLNQYYNEAYDKFRNGEYKVVKAKLDGVPAKFGAKNPLTPRFALLGAMTTGNLQGKEAYIAALKDVIAKYPDTPEQTRAREILRLLGVKGISAPAASAGSVADGTYTYEEDKLHYMIMVFKDKDVALNDAKITVSDYNGKYHKQDKLRISNIYLGGQKDKIPLIVIRRFKNKEAAMEYYETVEKNKADFVNDADFDLFPVTQSNYRTILKSKSLAGYKEFFELNYLN